MLSLPPTVRVFVPVEPSDMRGSFDAIAGAVRRIGLDPVDGPLYLFFKHARLIHRARCGRYWTQRHRSQAVAGIVAQRGGISISSRALKSLLVCDEQTAPSRPTP